MQFFSKEGTEISKEEFIKVYGDSYYSDRDRYVPGVDQNSRFVENEIDRLLKEGIKTKIDVVHIMAWKIGKVDHKKSENNKRFSYVSGWEGAEDFDTGNPIVQIYGKDFKLGELAKYVEEHITKLEKLAHDDPQGVLNRLKDLDINGLGPVYIITLLYFISRGKSPIYDQYALSALEAIQGGKEPGSKVEAHELPEKSSKRFGAIMQTEMRSYIDSIKSIFGTAYWENRDIDRALWVYGHMFDNKKEKKPGVNLVITTPEAQEAELFFWELLNDFESDIDMDTFAEFCEHIKNTYRALYSAEKRLDFFIALKPYEALIRLSAAAPIHIDTIHDVILTLADYALSGVKNMPFSWAPPSKIMDFYDPSKVCYDFDNDTPEAVYNRIKAAL